MCPSFRLTLDDTHSTRHRAATLKAALNGEYGKNPFIGPELAEAMELCVACKGCKRECPNGVDVAMLRTEALAQRWAELGKIPLRECLTAQLVWQPAEQSAADCNNDAKLVGHCSQAFITPSGTSRFYVIGTDYHTHGKCARSGTADRYFFQPL
jgi:ferredoxin